MTGALLLVAALCAVAATGWAVAACVSGGSLVTSSLAIVLVGFAEVVLLALALSAFGALGRPGLLVGIAVVLALALGIWRTRGRPAIPVRRGLSELRDAFTDPALAALGLLAALTVVYVAIVAAATPQLDWDSIAYHLPRALLWLQQGGLGSIHDAADVRLAWAPPAGETAIAVTLAIARSDRYVALPQLAALPVGMLAVAGISRRLGFETRACVFAGLVFGCLPIVLLQAPTAFNDLLVAAVLLAAFCLVLGRTHADTALCALALSLALWTKLTAALALPLFLALALAAAPRAWRRTTVAVAAGGGLGCTWYLVNLARTGSLDGGWAKGFDQVPDRDPLEILIRAERYSLDLLDLSGFQGGDRAVLPIAAAGVAAVALALLAASRATRRSTAVVLVACLVVAVLPWLVDGARLVLVRVFAHTLRLVGHGDRIGVLASDPPTAASPVFSWYGAVFALLWVATIAIAVVGVARGLVRPGLLALLAAPLAFAIAFAAAAVYDPGRGRFFVFPVGLAVACFALAYRFGILRVAAPVAAAASVVVTIVHSEPRPLGIQLFDEVRAPAVWGDDRFEGLDEVARMYGSATGWVALGRALDDAPTVGVVATREAALYPLFGDGNARRIVLVRDPAAVPPSVRLLVVTPAARAPRCDEPWRLRASPPIGYPVYERSAAVCRGDEATTDPG